MSFIFTGPLQLAAFFAYSGVLLGTIATVYLFGAICFHLHKATLTKISKAFLICAACFLSTFVAAALDICDSSSCKKVVHFDKGAMASVYAIILHLGAASATYHFAREAETTRSDSRSDASATEILPLYHEDSDPKPPSSRSPPPRQSNKCPDVPSPPRQSTRSLMQSNQPKETQN
jgi:hypothetical protein